MKLSGFSNRLDIYVPKILLPDSQTLSVKRGLINQMNSPKWYLHFKTSVEEALELLCNQSSPGLLGRKLSRRLLMMLFKKRAKVLSEMCLIFFENVQCFWLFPEINTWVHYAVEAWKRKLINPDKFSSHEQNLRRLSKVLLKYISYFHISY